MILAFPHSPMNVLRPVKTKLTCTTHYTNYITVALFGLCNIVLRVRLHACETNNKYIINSKHLFCDRLPIVTKCDTEPWTMIEVSVVREESHTSMVFT